MDNANKIGFRQKFGYDIDSPKFREELEATWNDMVDQGIKKGHLKRTKDSNILGLGDPDEWFDDPC